MDQNLKKGIVIVTSESTKDFLADCIASCVNNKYQILVVGNAFDPRPTITGDFIDTVVNDWNGFELGGIEQGRDYFDEFILLQDTVVIKDQKFFDECFDFDGSVYWTENCQYHFGAKFKSDILRIIGVPHVFNREQAIQQEWHWGHLYFETEKKWKYIQPIMPPGNHDMPIVERHGRKGILIETPYMEKHKTNY